MGGAHRGSNTRGGLWSPRYRVGIGGIVPGQAGWYKGRRKAATADICQTQLLNS